MRRAKFALTVMATLGVAITATGCGSGQSDIDKDFAAAKKLPRPSSAQIEKGFAEMARNQKAGADSYLTYLKAHPDTLKQINDGRKAAGLAPLNP